jgi:hypothetical protein
MKPVIWLGTTIVLAGSLVWLTFSADSHRERRREVKADADRACMVFCRDVEAVAVDGGVCACPVRDGARP